MTRPTLAAGLALVIVSGCNTSRDRAAAEGGWSIDSQATVDIAASRPDGQLVFGSAVGATRLGDGRLVVADGYESMVRFFGASGQPQTVTGRHGSGPGEFQSLAWLGQCGQDSIYVWDRMASRMSVIDQAGRIVRQSSMQPVPTTLTCARDGAMLFFGAPEAEAGSVSDMASVRYRAPLFLSSGADSTPQPLGTMPLGEPRPLGRMTHIALTADRMFVGPADSGLIRAFGRDGRELAPLLLELEPRRATPRQYEAAIEQQAALLPSAADREPIRKLMRAMPMPAHVPAYSGVLTDPLGVVWVQLSVPGDGETRLRGLRDGTAVANLYLPIEGKVFEVGNDHVLLAYQDAEGNEHVAQFRLLRGR